MTRSRIGLPICLSAFIVLVLVVGTRAQDDPNLIQGLKPYGAYHGSDLDLVSIENGKLDLHIPLLSYPQRGNLQMDFTVRVSNPTFGLGQVCPYKLPCTYFDYVTYTELPAGVSVIPDFASVSTNSGAVYGGGPPYPIITMPDGSSHTTGIIAGTTNYRATDASGWMFSAPINFGTGTAIAPNGTRYSMTGGGYASSVEDTNGNKITGNYTGSTLKGWTDSLEERFRFRLRRKEEEPRGTQRFVLLNTVQSMQHMHGPSQAHKEARIHIRSVMHNCPCMS